MFQALCLAENHDGCVIGRLVVWRWQRSNPDTKDFHHLFGSCMFNILSHPGKGLQTKYLAKGITKVIETFVGVKKVNMQKIEGITSLVVIRSIDRKHFLVQNVWSNPFVVILNCEKFSVLLLTYTVHFNNSHSSKIEIHIHVLYIKRLKHGILFTGVVLNILERDSSKVIAATQLL